MKNILIVLAITLCACAFTAWAQKSHPAGKSVKAAAGTSVHTSTKTTGDISVDTSVSKSTGIAKDAAADTSAHLSTDIAVDAAADSSSVNTPAAVVIDEDDEDDDERILAEIALDTTPLIRPDLIRREHDYRRQTRLAIVMMVFIAAALGTSQSWNPK
ncbi:MAG: hypothetical protein FWB85_01085 [Chitinispirillia bacterium]|nr:hypothetical protein [Chitinispirillia bacterium]